MEKKSVKTSVIHGVGRRKSAVARVWLKPGKGAVLVNGVDVAEYFDTQNAVQAAVLPLQVTQLSKKYDVKVNLSGGGKVGQAGAMKLGVARALVSSDEELRVLLRGHGLLTVDARVKERKKYGQRGARAKFQFVKR